MRARLLLIVAVLTVLAFVSLRHVDQQLTERRDSAPAAGQFEDQPVPDPALPAMVDAAVTASSPVQTLPHSGWGRHLRPASGGFTGSPHAQPVPDGVTGPRSYPLLI